MYHHAYAKINLTLDVGALRDDGYHDISSVMQTISLHDSLWIEQDDSQTPVRLICNTPGVPSGEENLVLRAARLFGSQAGISLEGIRIALHKEIPTMAGLGGGSADAAATLLGLNACTEAGLTHAQLQEIALRCGSDVPFCVHRGAALVTGRGEQLRALPEMPACTLVLVQPDFRCSTGALYAALDRCTLTQRPDTQGMLEALEQQSLELVCKHLCNVFEQALPTEERAVLDSCKQRLCDSGALAALMTGSGSVIYGVFAEEALAQNAAKELAAHYPFTALAAPQHTQ